MHVHGSSCIVRLNQLDFQRQHAVDVSHLPTLLILCHTFAWVAGVKLWDDEDAQKFENCLSMLTPEHKAEERSQALAFILRACSGLLSQLPHFPEGQGQSDLASLES